MDFKELIKDDISNVFLNPEEFGELHTVGNRKMCILVDDNEMIEREKRTPMYDGTEGVYKRKLLFYVKAADFGPLPAVGRLLTLDGGSYRVIDSINESGLYSISLEAVRAT